MHIRAVSAGTVHVEIHRGNSRAARLSERHRKINFGLQRVYVSIDQIRVVEVYLVRKRNLTAEIVCVIVHYSAVVIRLRAAYAIPAPRF